jgi:hypothetical protein
MADITLPQVEADALIAMEKFRTDARLWNWPNPGERLPIPLTSADKRESFILDITRARIKVTKATYQDRARQAIVLMRLDLDGPPHTNPDGQEIPCPHLHVYREGFGTKWATPLPVVYPDPAATDLLTMCRAFMADCAIVDPPDFQQGLFA